MASVADADQRGLHAAALLAQACEWPAPQFGHGRSPASQGVPLDLGRNLVVTEHRPLTVEHCRNLVRREARAEAQADVPQDFTRGGREHRPLNLDGHWHARDR